MKEINMRKPLLILGIGISLLFSFSLAHENRLFWDGGDWQRVEKITDFRPEISYQIKAAYVNGVQDGRLYYYLKTWGEQAAFADSLYADTIDYLSTRELVRSLDTFYKDQMNVYVPVPSAMIIANMYGEQISPEIIDAYVQQTKFWINELMLDMQREGAGQLLDDKILKHQNKHQIK